MAVGDAEAVDDSDGRKRWCCVAGPVGGGKPPQIRETMIEARVDEENRQISVKSGPGEAGGDAGSGKPPPGVFPSGF